MILCINYAYSTPQTLPHGAGWVQNKYMKLISLFLMVGMLTVRGWADWPKPEPYSEKLVKKAEAGDAVAQWSLGMCYSGGWNSSEGFVECKEVKKNPDEAIKWFTKSAEQGNSDAQFEMYDYYNRKAAEYMRTSDNIPRIEEARKKAEEWVLKAAEGGNLSAQKNLAHMYFYRYAKGVERIENLNVAKKFYIIVAEKGDELAGKMVRHCEVQIQKEQRLLGRRGSQ